LTNNEAVYKVTDEVEKLKAGSQYDRNRGTEKRTTKTRQKVASKGPRTPGKASEKGMIKESDRKAGSQGVVHQRPY